MEQIKRFFENMDEIVYIADMDNYEIIYMNKRQRELYFRFDYAEPNPVFVFTNIVKGECKGKRKSYFRLGFAETSPTLYKYRYFFGGQTRRIV